MPSYLIWWNKNIAQAYKREGPFGRGASQNQLDQTHSASDHSRFLILATTKRGILLWMNPFCV
jgi:hypothetical protein